MINFNDWLENKWQLLLGAGRDDWDDEDMKIAYNKGMERAAEIAKNSSVFITPFEVSEAIRKEIETISISDIRREIEK